MRRWVGIGLIGMVGCSPVYIPQKVMVEVPVYCKAPVVPDFINYISSTIPKTEKEQEILASQIVATLWEATEQNKELRQALTVCQNPKKRK